MNPDKLEKNSTAKLGPNWWSTEWWAKQTTTEKKKCWSLDFGKVESEDDVEDFPVSGRGVY